MMLEKEPSGSHTSRTGRVGIQLGARCVGKSTPRARGEESGEVGPGRKQNTSWEKTERAGRTSRGFESGWLAETVQVGCAVNPAGHKPTGQGTLKKTFDFTILPLTRMFILCFLCLSVTFSAPGILQ